ncbi:hypothetical protein GF359_01385 [candidate division WOR-3 bacterium]|uniref:Uncharacterized protein n=1 Tax=candidate division WOR-3 bacterium TaxID=2052148 RepID=A0A9D5K7S4_UNCW3|nr:hypothetical protein [candidate division WOR-3 bacterium]MBD3363848.1 hypothetical protein [candidate division WOR-3 bacterium]
MRNITWYAGSDAEETPRVIVYNDRKLNVDEVIDRALVYDTATTGCIRRLTVRCGKRILKLCKEFDIWQISEDYET